MDPMSIIMAVAGLVLFFVAPKLVGVAIKVVGIALIGLGAAIYLGFLLPSLAAPWLMIVAGLPVVAGFGLIFVAQGMAKLAVRIAGILLVVAGLSGMGLF